MFFLQSEDQPNGLSDPADHSRLTENVARAFCMALCPHLKLLKEDGMAKLGLRVTLDSDQVGWRRENNIFCINVREFRRVEIWCPLFFHCGRWVTWQEVTASLCCLST